MTEALIGDVRDAPRAVGDGTSRAVGARRPWLGKAAIGEGDVTARAPSLVAVVPVRDGGEDIGLCLDALTRAGLAAHDVIVVDDGSRDGAAQAAARRVGTRYVALDDGPHGPARARNEGVRLAADAEAFLFVDADVVVHPDAVERFRALLAGHPDIAAAFGSYDDSPSDAGWISQYKNLLHHWMHQRGAPEAATFWSGCGVVRREAFIAMGGFDEGFPTASIEDVDLGMRLVDAGHRVRLCREILCRHRKRWSLGGWLRTDIFARALPWSRLLVARARGIPDSLNVGLRERCSAVCALLLAASLPALALAPGAAAGTALGALAGFVALQRSLLGFFTRRHGVAFAAVATLMHLCYFVYSAVVYAWVRLSAPLRRAAPAARSPDATTWESGRWPERTLVRDTDPG